LEKFLHDKVRSVESSGNVLMGDRAWGEDSSVEAKDRRNTAKQFRHLWDQFFIGLQLPLKHHSEATELHSIQQICGCQRGSKIQSIPSMCSSSHGYIRQCAWLWVWVYVCPFKGNTVN